MLGFNKRAGVFTPAALKNSVSIAALFVGVGLLPSAMAVADEGAGAKLEEIVVTARRTEEQLQKIPVAVTAYNEAELTTRGMFSLLSIADYIPNVNVGSQSTGGTQNAAIYIRGIGQDRTGITFDQGVGLYVDDVFYGRSDSSMLAVLDVDRIEVLRGPQGTLFGKNTIGGAVRYITKKPTDTFGGYVVGTVGSFNRTNLKTSINLPLADQLYVKATFGSFDADGYVKEVAGNKSFGDDNSQIGRLQIRFLPTDKVTVDLSGEHTHTDTNGRAFTIAAINPNATWPTFLRNKTGGTQIYDTRYLTNDPYKIYGGRPTAYQVKNTNLNAAINFDLTDNVSLKSITGYLHGRIYSQGDYDGSPLPVFDTEFYRSIESISQELQLSGLSFDDRLKWVGGLYYMREKPKDTANTVSALEAFFPTARVTHLSQTTKSYAAFAQGTFKFTDQFSATVGIRYSEDKKEVYSDNVNRNFIGTGAGKWDSWSPRFSLEYQWTPDVMTYASATRGFRSGGINSGLLATQPNSGTPPRSYVGVVQPLFSYAPENVWTYEAGVRADIMDRARINATAFYTRYTNLQLTVFDAAQNITYIQNVGLARMQGIELEPTLLVTDNFQLRGSLGYIDAQYLDLGNNARGVTLASKFVKTPKVTYSIGGRYTVPLPQGDSVFANVDWSWRDTQSTASTDGNTVFLPSYGLLNARLQYNSSNSAWSLAVYATNLLDKVYYLGGIDMAREASIGPKQLDVGPPRQVGAEIKYSF